MTKEHAAFKIKNNEEYSTKLVETSLIDKVYDFEYNNMVDMIYRYTFCVCFFHCTLYYLHCIIPIYTVIDHFDRNGSDQTCLQS